MPRPSSQATSCITKVEVVEYPELGMEAGNDFFTAVNESAAPVTLRPS